jgi:hypothetical protein
VIIHLEVGGVNIQEGQKVLLEVLHLGEKLGLLLLDALVDEVIKIVSEVGRDER